MEQLDLLGLEVDGAKFKYWSISLRPDWGTIWVLFDWSVPQLPHL